MADLFIFKPHSVIDVITNSSSELFIIDKGIVSNVIKEFLRSLFDSPLCYFGVGLVYTLETEDDVKAFLNENVGWLYYVPYKDTYEEMRDAEATWLKENYKENMKKYLGCTIITSESDNSIPWDIVEIIENKLGAKRYHLG